MQKRTHFWCMLILAFKGCKLGAQMAGVKLMMNHVSGLH